QAEDGIRDKLVTGVQTCALPISKNHPIPMVRWQRRRSNEFLYLHFQKFKDRTHYSLWRRRAWTEGSGHVWHIPARWTRIHGVKRWSTIQIYRGHIVLRELRDAGRSR